jgi:hypothetical protein
MNKIKKPKQKRVNPARRSVKKALDIPVPDELSLPMVVDTTDQNAETAKVKQLNAHSIPLRNAASSPHEMEVVLKAFATIATNAWRAKTKMVNPDTGEAKEEMKRVYRHIEAIFESLNQIGIDTIDPIGRVYDSGMALRVVSFEPTPGLSNEEITETIKPTVAWQGRLIQIGEVIVGTPQTIKI